MPVIPLLIPWVLATALAPFDGRRIWVRWLAVLGLTASLVAAIVLAVDVFANGSAELVTGSWPEGIGITLRADALGVVFILLADGLLLLSLLYEVTGKVEERSFPVLVLFLAAGLTGLFLTGDAFNFYVFFEVSMGASFVLASYGHEDRRQERSGVRNALIFMVVNLLGSVIFLTGVVALYHVTGTLDLEGIATWVRTAEPTAIILIATLIFIAFSLKLGLFPFHFWLPAVYRGVHPVVAAILSGVLANIGSYGLLRFGGAILALEVRFAANVLLVLGGASVLYGALLAISRRTSGEVLAYSAISQAGYILIALTLGGPIGLAAAVLYAIVNGINKTLLFLTTGPSGRLVGAAFVMGAMSVAGLPPTAGFFGKVALFRASLAAGSEPLVILIFLGAALSTIYMFQIYQLEEDGGGLRSALALRRQLLIFGLACLVVALGVWPEPLLIISARAAEAIHRAAP